MHLTTDLFTSATVGPGDGSWATAEHPDLADVAVLLLDKPQEGRHVWTTKVVACLEAGEEAALGEPLEVVFTDVEHSGAQVKLVEKLGNEDVHV